MEHVNNLYSKTQTKDVKKAASYLEDIERLVRDGMFNSDVLK
ncbi:hypothetical protein [Psittacicella hinzii]|nr:hypothetical protein [Psittacicella hinzii]